MVIHRNRSGISIVHTLLRLALGHAWRRPLQSAFLIIGVALGVGIIVAMDLANNAANRAFALSTEAVVGKATHQIVGGPTGLDEGVYVALRHQLGYRLSAPIVADYVAVGELDAQPMQLFGVDSFAESPFRSYLGDKNTSFGDTRTLRAFVTQPRTVLMSADIARRYNLTMGDQLHVQVGSRNHALEIVGLLCPEGERSRRALEGLLITDIATAQEVLGKIGRLDRIDLIVPDGEDVTAILKHIAAILPPGARIERPEARNETVAEMTSAFQLNLTALSLLALLVGVFLIYNTVAFSVVQQRPVLGSLRALGMTRGEIFTIVLIEAGVLGIIGTLIGLGLGILLSRSAVQLVTQSLNDIFFVVTVRHINVPLHTLFKGVVSGVAAVLTAAMLPAYEATCVTPAGAFRRSNIEERTYAVLPWVCGAGVGVLMLGAILLLPEWHLAITFAGVFAIIIGIALLTPVLTLGLMRVLEIVNNAIISIRFRRSAQTTTPCIASPGAHRREVALFNPSSNTQYVRSNLAHVSHFTFHVIARMAIRDITRSLSRTSVAIGALMVAVSAIIGVSLMISSFRLTVERWLTDLLQADIFVSTPTLGRTAAPLDRAVVTKLTSFPGVAQVATSRVVDVHAGGLGAIQLVAVNMDIAGAKRHYKAAVGNHTATWQAMEAGGLIVNEPMANRFDLGVGDWVVLLTDFGEQRFPIVAVDFDFDVQLRALIHDPIYRKFWDDPNLSSVALFVEPDVDVDAKIDTLRKTFAGSLDLTIQSNRGLRASSLAIFDRAFSTTVALQMLATVVAFIGVLSTLMSLQLERRREIGTLRAIGMTRQQLWKLTFLETGLIGGCAGLIAIPTGILLSAILIYIINLRSFGWTLQIHLQAVHLLQAFIIALAAALLAGIYPAWRLGKMTPADALRME
jgi:putative ABC transport system permease protein